MDASTNTHHAVSIIIPIYNEADTLKILIEKLQSLSLDCEIILVDDGSTDSSRQIIHSLDYPNIRFLYHSSRTGKGLAVQTGLQQAKGDIVVIQDADLEYDPSDITRLVKLVESGEAGIALGVRDLASQKWMIRWGNRFLTWVTNVLYQQRIHDLTSCYKVMSRDVMLQLDIESKGFTLEAEIMAKLFRMGVSVAETSIHYSPRYKNKKLKIIDGVPMLWALIKYRFTKRIASSNVIDKVVTESV